MIEQISMNAETERQVPVLPMGIPTMLVVVFLCSCLAVSFSYAGELLGHRIHSANYVMIFLTGILFVSCNSSRRVSLLASLMSVLSYDFFFVEPYYTLIPSDKQYWIVVGFMFFVALVVNELAYRAKNFAVRANQLEKEAETEKLKNTLLRSVSHDLKTPLTSIMGAATLLADSKTKTLSEESRKELALSIADESSRLNRIVSNLLDMTRLDTAGIVLNKDWYYFDELLANSIASIESRHGEQLIELSLDSNLPLIKVDPLLFEQLFTNIFENCVKYSPGTEYAISAKKDGETMLVTVVNEGPVIPNEEIERVFEKFHQADSSKPGAGLGLSICKSIVELHDGKIWFDRDLESGVRLNMFLPLSEKAPEIALEDL